MALAARSSADPRTACPVCGGSIHPIAGKCKHCKTDLVKLRRQQQAAAGTPPPARLPYGAPARPPTAPVVPVPMNGSHSAPVAAAPVIISAPVAAIDPFAMSEPPPPRGAWSRSWPIVVAVIAAGAIVVSVILLLTGGNGRDHKLDHVVQSPAPDHMDTNPDLPSDPWQGANPGSGGAGNTLPTPPDPTAPSQGAPVPPPPPSAPSAPSAMAVPPPEEFNSAMFQAVCSRFTACGVLDANAKQFCDELVKAAQFADPQMKDRIARGECTYDRDKASTCMSALSSLPCDQGQGADLGQLSQMILGVGSCTDVLACH